MTDYHTVRDSSGLIARYNATTLVYQGFEYPGPVTEQWATDREWESTLPEGEQFPSDIVDMIMDRDRYQLVCLSNDICMMRK